MDELERDLRSALDRLADGTVASDDLVDRTLARSVQIRRRRRAITVSGVAVAFAAMAALASVADAATRAHVRVTAPPVTEPAATTTTGPPTSIVVTTTAPLPPRIGSGTRPRTPDSSARVTTSTIPAACGPPKVAPIYDGTFTILPDGDIQAEFSFSFGPAHELHYETFDDGTPGDTVAVKVYTPAEFGPHWLDAWTFDADGKNRSCTERFTFDVDPALTTTSTTVTTTVPDTTIPASTTIPPTTTTAP